MTTFPHAPDSRHARSDGSPVSPTAAPPERRIAEKRMKKTRTYREQKSSNKTYGNTGGVVAPGAFKV